MKDLVQIALESRGCVMVERCFYQVFRPGEKYAAAREGKGYCHDCTFYPKENKQCTGYRPVTVNYQLKEER
jgi:hypothetical protein